MTEQKSGIVSDVQYSSIFSIKEQLPLFQNISYDDYAWIWTNSFQSYYRGISRLEGKGELIDKWMNYEARANSLGKVIVVKKGGKLLTVSLGKSDILFQNAYEEYTLLSIWHRDEKGKSEPWKEEFSESDFAVFENNFDCLPDLTKVNFYLKSMWICLERIWWDQYRSQKRLITFWDRFPDAIDWEPVVDNYDKGYISIIAPDDITNEIKGHQYLETRNAEERKQLWRDYDTIKNEMYSKYGIRFDVLQNKEERANLLETQAANSLFDAWENERAQYRLKFIRWVKKNWGEKFVGNNCILIYAGKRYEVDLPSEEEEKENTPPFSEIEPEKEAVLEKKIKEKKINDKNSLG